MTRLTLLVVSMAAMTGCAALAGLRDSPDPRAQLEDGAAAVEAQEYLRARGLLEPLVREHPSHEIGQRALLVLIAAELDNRNPERRLWAAADMAARLLETERVERWVVPVAESYYLLAMELGAAEERIAAAEAQARRADAAARRTPPASTRPSVPVQLDRVRTERDQARRQADQLQQQLATRDRELRETRQELERIKRTIRP
jgi:hypothetical protein